MTRQIILDTETTGLETKEGHRIIEIGCLELIDRRITGSTFHQYINPERSIERGAEEVHGITEADLVDKPKFADIVDAFLEYVHGAELIIHNAPFDVGFINHEFQLLNKKISPIDRVCAIVDSLTIARQKHPGQRNSLDALCQRYSVDNSNRELHGALLDAELLAQVYLLLTGGQTQLFGGETDAATGQVTVSIERLDADRPPLRVTPANTSELSEHEAFLARMRKQDACLWD